MYTWEQVVHNNGGSSYYKLLNTHGGHVATLQRFLGHWRIVCRVTLAHTSKAAIAAHEIPSVSASADPPFELALGLFLLSWEG